MKVPSTLYFGSVVTSKKKKKKLVRFVVIFSGDYTLLEKLFGQTSNNKARMDLKKQVLAKADIPTDPEMVSSKHDRAKARACSQRV